MDMSPTIYTTGVNPPPMNIKLKDSPDRISDTILELERQQYEVYCMIVDITCRLIEEPLNKTEFENVDQVVKDFTGHKSRLSELRHKNRVIMDMLADIIQVL